MAYQKYTDMLINAEGSLSDKVNALMMHYADEWGWDGSDSIIADMLDNGLDAQSTIAILEAALRHECQTAAFQAAVQAITEYQMLHQAQAANNMDYRGTKTMPLQAALAESAIIS